MTQIDGLSRLLTEVSDRPEPGWIFMRDRSAAFTAEKLLTTEYFLADDDDEAIDMEADFAAFLEYPTFRSIMALEKEEGRGDLHSLAEACMYYLEKDNFRP